MARFHLADRDGLFDLEVRTSLPAAVLSDERTEPVLASALLLSVATLIEGGEWPTRALQHLRAFMSAMHREVSLQRQT